MLLGIQPQHRAYWSTALEPFGDIEKHESSASEGTRMGPDTVELTAQAGEGWATMLLNCPPLALSLFSPPGPLSFREAGFSLG